MSFSGDLDVEEFVKKFVRGDFDINHEDPNTKTLRDALTKYQIGKSEARISKIIAVGRNVILGMDYNEVFKYKVDRNAPLPTGEPIDRLAEGAEKMQ